jgi:Domain of unknown function (DUF4158)
MASIERTAYPRLNQNFTKSELKDFYTLTSEELFFVRETARNEEPQLHLLLNLKLFQKLNYVPYLEDVIESLVLYLRSAVKFRNKILPEVTKRTL